MECYHLIDLEDWEYLRREEAAFANQDGNVDVIASTSFAHQAGEAVIEVLRKGIKLLLNIESDYSNLALGCQSDLLFEGRHSGQTGRLTLLHGEEIVGGESVGIELVECAHGGVDVEKDMYKAQQHEQSVHAASSSEP